MTSEGEISIAVLQILAKSPEGTADMQQLVKEVPHYIELTDADRAQSATREHEELWEQRVRNIKSHHASDGNLIAEGLAEDAGKGLLRITDAGRNHLKTNGY